MIFFHLFFLGSLYCQTSTEEDTLTSSSSNPKELDNMPDSVLQRLYEYLPLQDGLSLRSTANIFRKTFDITKTSLAPKVLQRAFDENSDIAINDMINSLKSRKEIYKSENYDLIARIYYFSLHDDNLKAKILNELKERNIVLKMINGLWPLSPEIARVLYNENCSKDPEEALNDIIEMDCENLLKYFFPEAHKNSLKAKSMMEVALKYDSVKVFKYLFIRRGMNPVESWEIPFMLYPGSDEFVENIILKYSILLGSEKISKFLYQIVFKAKLEGRIVNLFQDSLNNAIFLDECKIVKTLQAIYPATFFDVRRITKTFVNRKIALGLCMLKGNPDAIPETVWQLSRNHNLRAVKSIFGEFPEKINEIAKQLVSSKSIDFIGNILEDDLFLLHIEDMIDATDMLFFDYSRHSFKEMLLHHKKVLEADKKVLEAVKSDSPEVIDIYLKNGLISKLVVFAYATVHKNYFNVIEFLIREYRYEINIAEFQHILFNEYNQGSLNIPNVKKFFLILSRWNDVLFQSFQSYYNFPLLDFVLDNMELDVDSTIDYMKLLAVDFNYSFTKSEKERMDIYLRFF
ncbi:hypothetical protein O9G_003407 [Rozella allomycis CSF55]|uniref:F-box domain-containing protein n=1 Tax=Rozella allomycis (strain CSF55) TaxID=988480 RepID=A0A075APZ7_ROZAC|nr:hypothetical protein O9G_003407 [Rozella allomycis CSF55]|eukprot:EPZ32263.1 hypothetical protein O9G_003407 [Rozella allomycis CSF55]